MPHAKVSSGVDTTELLRSLGFGDKVDLIPTGAGDLAAAWALCALTGPARGLVTIGAAPVIAQWRGKRAKGNEAASAADSAGSDDEKRQ